MSGMKAPMSEKTIYLNIEPTTDKPGDRGAAHSKILQFAFDLGVYAERTRFNIIRVQQVDWWVTAITIHSNDVAAYTALKLVYGEMFMSDFTGPAERSDKAY
jgi:hypothetical protein